MPREYVNGARRYIIVRNWICCNCGLNHSMQTPQCVNPECQHAYHKRCCRTEDIPVLVEPPVGTGGQRR